MNAGHIVGALLLAVWPPPSGIVMRRNASESAVVFAVRRVTDESDAIEIRTEADEALVYIHGAGPLEFDLSEIDDERLLVALLQAARDGRLRGVVSLDRRGHAAVEQLQLLDEDGEPLDALFLPIDVPRPHRSDRKATIYEPLR